MTDPRRPRLLRRTLTAIAATAIFVVVGAAAAPHLNTDPAPATPAEPKPVRGVPVVAAVEGVAGAQLTQALAADRFVRAVHFVEAVTFAQAVEAHRAQQAALAAEAERLAEQQAARTASRVASPAPPVSEGGRGEGGVGECTGFPVPDHVIQRESGGSATAQNASGAWGCTQIMPEWWADECGHLDKHSVDGQRACTQIVMDLQGPGAWAATW